MIQHLQQIVNLFATDNKNIKLNIKLKTNIKLNIKLVLMLK